MFVLPIQPDKSCAKVQSQELGLGFSSQNLRLSSGTAFGSDGQITDRGSNFDSNLNSAAWPTSCNGFIYFESQKIPYVIWILFRSVEDAETIFSIQCSSPWLLGSTWYLNCCLKALEADSSHQTLPLLRRGATVCSAAWRLSSCSSCLVLMIQLTVCCHASYFEGNLSVYVLAFDQSRNARHQRIFVFELCSCWSWFWFKTQAEICLNHYA